MSYTCHPQAYLLADEVDPNATTFTDDSKCDTAIVVGSDSMGLTLPASFVWNRQRNNTNKPSTDAVSKAEKDKEELNPLAVPLSSDVQVRIPLLDLVAPGNRALPLTTNSLIAHRD